MRGDCGDGTASDYRADGLVWPDNKMKGQGLSRIALFGAYGQLGSDFLVKTKDRGWDVRCAPRDLRIEHGQAVGDFIRACEPEWVLNAAAMTDVDAAHRDPDRALQVNGLGPGLLARAAHDVSARVIHISSEAVYDGSRQVPYVEGDACLPVSVYGGSKLTGDLLTLTYSPDSFVLRTSWLYSGQRGSNFPTRIVDQLTDPEKTLSVVTDIVGNPTPTAVLINAITAVLNNPPDPGLYHVCTVGSASKYDWAVEIATQAGFDPARITAVNSDAYPTVAQRPKHVDLDCTKFLDTGLLKLPTWREAWLTEIGTWNSGPAALHSPPARP